MDSAGQRVNTVQVYSILILGGLLGLLLWRQLSVLLQALARVLAGRVRRHLLYPRLRAGSHVANPWRGELAANVIHWTVTGFCNAWRVGTLHAAGSRAGKLAVIHLVPLFTSLQLSFLASLFGVSTSCAHRVHSSLGVIAIVQSVLHTIIVFYDMDVSTVA